VRSREMASRARALRSCSMGESSCWSPFSLFLAASVVAVADGRGVVSDAGEVAALLLFLPRRCLKLSDMAIRGRRCIIFVFGLWLVLVCGSGWMHAANIIGREFVLFYFE